MFIVVGLYYCTTLAGWWFNTRGPHTYAQRWDLFKMHGTIFNKFYLNTKIHMRLVDIIIGQGPYISRIACDNHWLTWHSTAAISTSLLHPLFRCPIGPPSCCNTTAVSATIMTSGYPILIVLYPYCSLSNKLNPFLNLDLYNTTSLTPSYIFVSIWRICLKRIVSFGNLNGLNLIVDQNKSIS